MTLGHSLCLSLTFLKGHCEGEQKRWKWCCHDILESYWEKKKLGYKYLNKYITYCGFYPFLVLAKTLQCPSAVVLYDQKGAPQHPLCCCKKFWGVPLWRAHCSLVSPQNTELQMVLLWGLPSCAQVDVYWLLLPSLRPVLVFSCSSGSSCWSQSSCSFSLYCICILATAHQIEWCHPKVHCILLSSIPYSKLTQSKAKQKIETLEHLRGEKVYISQCCYICINKTWQKLPLIKERDKEMSEGYYSPDVAVPYPAAALCSAARQQCSKSEDMALFSWFFFFPV